MKDMLILDHGNMKNFIHLIDYEFSRKIALMW